MTSHDIGPCPCCGRPGQSVADRTVRALAREPVPEGRHALCLSPDCALVYYGLDGDARIMKDRLRTTVGFKEFSAPHLVCYCFGHTVEEIEQDLLRAGSTEVPQRIRSRIQAGECACTVKNPKGVCCLGDVGRAVKRAHDRIDGRSVEYEGAPPKQCWIVPPAEEAHGDCCGFSEPPIALEGGST